MGEDKIRLPLPSFLWSRRSREDSKFVYDSIFKDIEIDKFGLLCRYRREQHRVLAKKHRLPTNEEKMTPQEQLFVKFFNEQRQSVVNMSDLELEAEREGLIQIAYEARAKLSATELEKEERRSKSKKISDSVRTDTESQAINSIKKRNSKITPMDKVRASLRAAGVSEEEIASITSAKTVWSIAKNSAEKQQAAENQQTDKSETEKPAEPKFKFKSPFQK